MTDSQTDPTDSEGFESLGSETKDECSAGDATGVTRPAVSRDRFRERRNSRTPLQTARSWTVTFVCALAITALVKTFLLQPYTIPSGSMIPTLEIGDRVVVSKLSRDPERGDVIVFRRPANDPAPEGQPEVLIKRVIGLPGDTVSAVSGKVYVNGQQLSEPYLDNSVITDRLDEPITVPKGKLLVMGDNRLVSQDGRVFGPISKSLIVGRALARIWPPNRIGGL